MNSEELGKKTYEAWFCMLTRCEVLLLLAQQKRLIDNSLQIQGLVSTLYSWAREKHVGLAVHDSSGQRLGTESSEDDRVDGSNSSTGKHGNGKLGHHGHVDAHSVALLHSPLAQVVRKLQGEIKPVREKSQKHILKLNHIKAHWNTFDLSPGRSSSTRLCRWDAFRGQRRFLPTGLPRCHHVLRWHACQAHCSRCLCILL